MLYADGCRVFFPELFVHKSLPCQHQGGGEGNSTCKDTQKWPYLQEIVSNLPMHIRIAHLRWSTSRVPTVIHMMLAHEDRVWILVICNLTSVKNEAKNEVPEFSALICLSSVVIVRFCVVFDSIGAQLDIAEALEVVDTVPDIVFTEPPSLEGEKTTVALHSCFCIPEPYANRGSTVSCAILMYTSI